MSSGRDASPIPNVSYLSPTIVTIVHPGSGEMPWFDPMTMRTNIHLYDVETGALIHTEPFTYTGGGQFTVTGLTPEHQYVAKLELYDIYDQHVVSPGELITTPAIPALPTPPDPNVSYLSPTIVTIVHPGSGEMPWFDPMTMRTNIHLYDVETGALIHTEPFTYTGGGQFTVTGLTPEHQYVAKLELYDIYDQHVVSPGELITTPAIPALPTPPDPNVSYLSPTIVTIVHPGSGEMPWFDPMTMRTNIHLYDVETGALIHTEPFTYTGGGQFTVTGLTPEHQYVAKLELYDIYDQHVVSPGELITTPAIQPL